MLKKVFGLILVCCVLALTLVLLTTDDDDANVSSSENMRGFSEEHSNENVDLSNAEGKKSLEKNAHGMNSSDDSWASFGSEHPQKNGSVSPIDEGISNNVTVDDMDISADGNVYYDDMSPPENTAIRVDNMVPEGNLNPLETEMKKGREVEYLKSELRQLR